MYVVVESFWRVIPLLEGLGSVQDISTLFVCMYERRERGGKGKQGNESEREGMEERKRERECVYVCGLEGWARGRVSVIESVSV